MCSDSVTISDPVKMAAFRNVTMINGIQIHGGEQIKGSTRKANCATIGGVDL